MSGASTYPTWPVRPRPPLADRWVPHLLLSPPISFFLSRPAEAERGETEARLGLAGDGLVGSSQLRPRGGHRRARRGPPHPSRGETSIGEEQGCGAGRGQRASVAAAERGGGDHGYSGEGMRGGRCSPGSGGGLAHRREGGGRATARIRVELRGGHGVLEVLADPINRAIHYNNCRFAGSISYPRQERMLQIGPSQKNLWGPAYASPIPPYVRESTQFCRIPFRLARSNFR